MNKRDKGWKDLEQWAKMEDEAFRKGGNLHRSPAEEAVGEGNSAFGRTKRKVDDTSFEDNCEDMRENTQNMEETGDHERNLMKTFKEEMRRERECMVQLAKEELWKE